MFFNTKTTVLVITNVILSVAIVLVNKRLAVVENFRFMTILTGLHFYFSFFASYAMMGFSVLTYRQVNDYSAILRIAGASLVSIVAMNYSLAHSTVGFYQIAKLFCIPVSLALERVFGMSNQSFSLALFASLFLIMAGMYLVAEQEVHSNRIGVLWTALGVASTAVAQVFFMPLKKKLKLSALELLFHTSPWMAGGCFTASPLLDDLGALYHYKLSFTFIITISLSCLIAVAFNNINYMLLSEISPITYSVLGHFKTIATILLGIYFFDNNISSRTIMGISVALLGVGLYSLEMNIQKNKNVGTGSSGSGSGSGSDNDKGSNRPLDVPMTPSHLISGGGSTALKYGGTPIFNSIRKDVKESSSSGALMDVENNYYPVEQRERERDRERDRDRDRERERERESDDNRFITSDDNYPAIASKHYMFKNPNPNKQSQIDTKTMLGTRV